MISRACIVFLAAAAPLLSAPNALSDTGPFNAVAPLAVTDTPAGSFQVALQHWQDKPDSFARYPLPVMHEAVMYEAMHGESSITTADSIPPQSGDHWKMSAMCLGLIVLQLRRKHKMLYQHALPGSVSESGPESLMPVRPMPATSSI